MPNGLASTLSYRVSGGEANSVDVELSQTTGLQLKQFIAHKSNLMVEGMRVLVRKKIISLTTLYLSLFCILATYLECFASDLHRPSLDLWKVREG